MAQIDFDDEPIDWENAPVQPVVAWQGREARYEPADAIVGVVTLAVAALGAFALGMLVNQRLSDNRSPLKRWF